MNRAHGLSALVLLLSSGCSDVEGKEDGHDHDHHGHNHGVTTSLYLEFTPQAGGETLSFGWSDPEDDGAPIIDDVVLSDGETYDLSIEVWNDLEDPAEDVTPEIAAEAEEHQFFFTGDSVQGPATGTNEDAIIEHAYADSDADGVPLGLDNTVSVLAAGAGTLTVTLRHLPPEGGNVVKTGDLASEVASGGIDSIAGDNDIQVEFAVSVE